MDRFRRRGPHRYRDEEGKLWIDGDFFMGRFRTPPMPVRIAMTDRVTGLIRVLSMTGTAPGLTIDLVAINARWPDVIIFGPYEGPYSGNYRLLLDNGILSFEPAIDHNSPRIFTRRNFETTVLEITAGDDGSVVYTEIEL